MILNEWLRLCHKLLQVHFHQSKYTNQGPDLRDGVRVVVDGLGYL